MTNTKINTVSRSTRHAWVAYWTRQKAAATADNERRSFGDVNYVMIIDIAEEWLYAKDSLYRARVEEGFGRYDNVWLPSHPTIARCCDDADAAYSKLHTVCQLTHVNIDAAIKAAKVRIRSAQVNRRLSDLNFDSKTCLDALMRLA